MYMMLFGLVLLLGVHVLVSLRGVRAQMVARLGEGQYKGFFSLVAVSGLLLTAYGFALWRAAGSTPVWDPPLFMRHITMLLMLFAAIAGVAAYVPSHIKAKLKHPLLVAVKIWALAHLLSNGDIASIVLFGSVLAWAVYDRISLKRRGDPLPVAPQGYRGDMLAVAGGLVVYLLLAFVFHPYVVGVPVMG